MIRVGKAGVGIGENFADTTSGDGTKKITSLEKELAAIFGTPAPAAKALVVKPVKKKGGMSAAGRARVAAAQRARWAMIKAAKKA